MGGATMATRRWKFKVYTLMDGYTAAFEHLEDATQFALLKRPLTSIRIGRGRVKDIVYMTGLRGCENYSFNETVSIIRANIAKKENDGDN